jgi:GDP-L-fucose synthase
MILRTLFDLIISNLIAIGQPVIVNSMDLTNKKILVTGGNGFVGSVVVKKLLERGVPKKNIFTPRASELDLVKWENCVKAVAGMDVVIHLAAAVGGIGANREHPGKFFYENLMMGVQLIEAARQAKVEKFVAIGTVCAYPKFTPVPFKEDDLWIGYPEETNAPYGLAKKMLLVQAQAYRQEYGMNTIYLLPVNLYGPNDNFDPKHSHVLPALIKKVADAMDAKQNYIDVWGTGVASREFLYVDDAAEGIVLATEKYDGAEAVNLGSSFEITIKDLIGIICKTMGFTGELRWDPTKPDGQPRRKLDVSRAEKEFGFKSKVTFEEGLKKTIEWYLKNRV